MQNNSTRKANYFDTHNALDGTVSRDSSSGLTIILKSSKSDVTAVSHELRRRGFVIKASTVVPSTSSFFALNLSKRLLAKLAIKSNLQIKAVKRYSPFQQLCMANQAMHILRRARVDTIDTVAVWLAHNDEQLKHITSAKHEQKLSLINSYYGPQIALYFGFLAFYTNELISPSIAGCVLFIHQVWKGNVDSPWVPLFCILLALWSTGFLQMWKRRCAELSYAWNSYGSEDLELTRELAKAVHNEHNTRAIRRVLSAVAAGIMVYAMIELMLYYNYIHTHSSMFFGESWYRAYIPILIYSILTSVGCAIFDPISEHLNDFEQHPTKAHAEESLVIKRFALQFVNKYCALLYAAFWLKDLERVQSLLIFLLLVGAVS